MLHLRRLSQRALPVASLRALKLLLSPTRVQKTLQKKRHPHLRAVLKNPTLKPPKKPPSLRRKPLAPRAALRKSLLQKATLKVLLLAMLRVFLRALQRLLQKSPPLSCVLLRPQAQKGPLVRPPLSLTCWDSTKVSTRVFLMAVTLARKSHLLSPVPRRAVLKRAVLRSPISPADPLSTLACGTTGNN